MGFCFFLNNYCFFGNFENVLVFRDGRALEILYSTGSEYPSGFSTGMRVEKSQLILLKPGYL